MAKELKIKKYKGAIFDVDGTLLDSMQIWRNVDVEYLRSMGLEPLPGLSEEVSTLGGMEIPEYFQAKYGIRLTAEEINDGINKMLETFYHHKAPLKKGVIPVLELLRSKGIKICAATATDRCLIEPALERCGILSYFRRIFTCNEEQASKSRPDIYIRAAAFLGTRIKDTLVFEDASYAIRTAKKAGFPVAAVYDLSFKDQQEEIKKQSDYYFESLTDFPGVSGK